MAILQPIKWQYDAWNNTIDFKDYIEIGGKCYKFEMTYSPNEEQEQLLRWRFQIRKVQIGNCHVEGNRLYGNISLIVFEGAC